MSSPQRQLSAASAAGGSATRRLDHQLTTAADNRLVRRICGEFLEMPGLRLTCEQAQRLWCLDRDTCLEVLQSLVNAKFLCRRQGMYMRFTDGSERVEGVL
jgi:hypothetical protein